MWKINKKTAGWTGALLLLYMAGFQIPAPAEWQKPIQPSLAGGALTCLSVHPLDPAKFLVASGHDIFEGGRENAWQPLWSQADAGAPIQRLLSFASLPGYVFALAGDKIFMGDLKSRSWRMIYQDSFRAPLSFAVHPDDPNHWFLGTQKGLWETENAGKTWSPSRIFHGSEAVPLVIFDENLLLIGTESSLYLSSAKSAARQVFSLSRTNLEPEEEEASDSDEDAIFYAFKIHDLLAVKGASSKLFLATQSGVFQSLDHGFHWEPLSQSGLRSTSILQLAYSAKGNRLYAATPRGIYAYDFRSCRWTGLFEGLARDRAQSIAVLNEEKLLAITQEGFVQYPLGPFVPEAGNPLTVYKPPEETLALLRELISLEPSAREVHKRVIKYANVANGKIKRWQALSRLAGTLPTLSLGKNLDRSASISTYSGKYITGPEDGWDARAGWDLGDVIYSSDQPSIDSREKLMVELRNDLLSEATRIYYERRCLQIELIFTPPASEQEHLEDLLRVDELTALLDGMTDGFFSKQLERVYDARPEFEKLWNYVPRNAQSATHNE
jgi:hypothetical protein